MTIEMTLPEYIDAVQDTLQYWLDIHTNAKAWAHYWDVCDNWVETLKLYPEISNDYFEFNLTRAAIYQYAKAHKSEYGKCRKCGMIWDAWQDCDQCNRPLGEVTIKALAEWLEDIGMSPETFTESEIERAMEEQGFKAYQEGIRGTIAPVVAEVKDCLKSIKRDPLVGVAWANHVMHVNGNILADYGDHSELDYDFVCRVSQEGLQAVFGEEAVAEY